MNLVNGCRLQYFKPSEFIRRAVKGGTLIDWSNDMERRLLVMLDTLRSLRGQRIVISNGDGVLGRYTGKSYHCLPYWGQVMASDVVAGGVFTRNDAEKFYYQAKQLGFGGIGLYPQWNQGIGWHLDTGSCEPYKPKQWGYVDGQFVSIQAAFEHLGANPRIQPQP
jgi:hypothetical protein